MPRANYVRKRLDEGMCAYCGQNKHLLLVNYCGPCGETNRNRGKLNRIEREKGQQKYPHDDPTIIWKSKKGYPLKRPVRIGEKIGELTVLGLAEPRGYQVYWRCRCSCGTERDFPGQNLFRLVNPISSCGRGIHSWNRASGKWGYL